MFYKLKLRIFAVNLLRRIYRYLKLKRTSAGKPVDKRNELIEKYCKEKTFLDVGCMWGINGYFSFLAEELGAKEVTAFDIFEANEQFKKIHNERNSRVVFKRGDINSVGTLTELGKFDVVYCTGLLYHVPDPLYTLSRLRQICSDKLILGTAIVPEMNGLKNFSVFYPYLSDDQRRIWDIKQGEQLGITSFFDPEQGYGNWIWGFTNSCLESMLKTVGFDIIERHVGKFYSYVVCNLSDKEFLAVSGDWTVPEFRANIENYKFD